MTEIKDRDDILFELYNNRSFYIFFYGEDWFNKKAEKIHWDWLQSGTWLTVDDITVSITKTCWEVDKGFLD